MAEDLEVKARELQSLLGRCSGLLKGTGRMDGQGKKPRELEAKHDRMQISELQGTIKKLKQELANIKKHEPRVESQTKTKETQESLQESYYDYSEDNTTLALVLVFRFLTFSELLLVGRVSRQWQRASLHPSLWELIDLSDYRLDSDVLIKLANSCTSTKQIILQGLTPPPATPKVDLQGYIDSQKAGLEAGLKALLSKAGPSLLSLSISQCPLRITERSLWITSFTSPSLVFLLYQSEEFPPTPESIWSLSNGCPRIQSLHLYPTEDEELDKQYNDRVLYHIGKGFPLLTELTIGGQGLTISGITQLMSRLPRLHTLHLVKGPQISYETANHFSSILPSLLLLQLTHTPISPQAVIKIIDTHKSLKTFHIQISFIDYFADEGKTRTLGSEKKYQQIINNFEAIAQHSKYGGVFQVTDTQ
ncbi:PREDICTED: F-box only protein 41-like [Amphimedon queenslandica]|uniref:F-box domain-containing protein n=2 Tax=Amphimedon queenslandica TaxID=400682 RepID=A0AAN0ILR5_AMPQE|nr:PREDICTED: F-box only protein 41-like [Amphimedon queenslandica]|eukprot:XP_011404088.1 PREDICTED: F-box only protein 41-like [Amphimedon queenslandica]